MYKLKCEMLQNQVDLMQKQIDSLNNNKQQLYKQLENLTTALTAAQAIQGIQQQQRFIEANTDNQEQAEQPKRKQGFFARFFKRS